VETEKEDGEEEAQVPTYDNRDLLVNIGRRDGSWESARGENKDTRCSGIDNDRAAGGSA